MCHQLPIHKSFACERTFRIESLRVHLRVYGGHCVQELSVRECTRLSDEAVAAVAANGGLESLDVSLVPSVGAATAIALASFCRCLHFAFCKRTSELLIKFVTRCHMKCMPHGCPHHDPRIVLLLPA